VSASLHFIKTYYKGFWIRLVFWLLIGSWLLIFGLIQAWILTSNLLSIVPQVLELWSMKSRALDYSFHVVHFLKRKIHTGLGGIFLDDDCLTLFISIRKVVTQTGNNFVSRVSFRSNIIIWCGLAFCLSSKIVSII